MNTLLDLKPFCSTDPLRSKLHEPWSDVSHTFASDGRIIIAVPRRDDIPDRRGEAPKNAMAEVFVNQPNDGNFLPLPPLPEPVTEDCASCFGQLPDCTRCAGTGRLPACQPVSIGRQSVDARFLRLIKDLPGVQIACHAPEKDPYHLGALTFRFDGGEGRIMPLRIH